MWSLSSRGASRPRFRSTRHRARDRRPEPGERGSRASRSYPHLRRIGHRASAAIGWPTQELPRWAALGLAPHGRDPPGSLSQPLSILRRLVVSVDAATIGEASGEVVLSTGPSIRSPVSRPSRSASAAPGPRRSRPAGRPGRDRAVARLARSRLRSVAGGHRGPRSRSGVKARSASCVVTAAGIETARTQTRSIDAGSWQWR